MKGLFFGITGFWNGLRDGHIVQLQLREVKLIESVANFDNPRENSEIEKPMISFKGIPIPKDVILYLYAVFSMTVME